jgi:putative membrane protein
MIKNIKSGFTEIDYTTLATLTPNVAAVGIYTAFLIYLEDRYHIYLKLPASIFSLLGIVLGLLLVFRTNTSYDRWWEGRRIWGGLVDASRNMALKLHAYLPAHDTETRDFFARMIPNYSFALKEHMRDGVIFSELEEPVNTNIIAELKQSKHRPNRISGMIFSKINQLANEKKITQEQLLTLDKLSDIFTNAVGGCERIKNTPMPKSYSKHLDRFVLIYTIILPFGFIHDLDWWAVPAIMIIYFALEGIKTIGEEIEDPFGTDANDLATETISNNIRKNIQEILLNPSDNTTITISKV